MIYIKMDLALNTLQKLICLKTQITKPNHYNFSIIAYNYYGNENFVSAVITK